jgi:hypothetical protein
VKSFSASSASQFQSIGRNMARLNAEYGSELHLLRMLGRHRVYVTRKIRDVTRADDVQWLDFPSGRMRRNEQGQVLWDREWHQLQFLQDGDPARRAWEAVWPTHRTGHNWDAIGRLQFGPTHEWLLVEAKANVEELSSDCQARDCKSLERIRETLNRTKSALGGDASCHLLSGRVHKLFVDVQCIN